MAIDLAILEQAFLTGGASQGLANLASQLEQARQYHELFEALKMEQRFQLGLPPLPLEAGSEELSEAVRNSLETGLIEACRKVGTLLLRDGRIREGWMYLRPVGDKALAARLLEGVTPDDDNTEELVEVLLHEGVDTGRGFRLLLAQNGTCNAITTFDQIIAGRPRAERQAAAAALLEQLHADLVANVKTDVLRQEGAMPAESTLEGLFIDRDWLFSDGAYHIDTTHLASVVRMARVLESPEQLRKGLDLTHYGRRLSVQLQYPGDEPFVDQYAANALFYSALLGERVEEALDYFRKKASLLDPQYHGTEPLEVYLDLLNRLGRREEALAAACQLLPAQVPFSAYGPVLLDLCGKTGNFEPMREFCRTRTDALGFAAALLNSSAKR